MGRHKIVAVEVVSTSI